MDILIADDHALHRELMRAKLEGVYPDARILEAENCEQVKSSCSRHNPTLLILDIFMPGMHGLMGVADIVRQFPETKVLICSAVDNPILARTMLAFGARGYISKSMPAGTLLKGIEQVLNGDIFVPQQLAHNGDIQLTQRQAEILGMMCSGLSNKEIAQELHLSVSTVKFHVSMVLDTLGVQSRQQAISICGLAA